MAKQRTPEAESTGVDMTKVYQQPTANKVNAVSFTPDISGGTEEAETVDTTAEDVSKVKVSAAEFSEPLNPDPDENIPAAGSAPATGSDEPSPEEPVMDLSSATDEAELYVGIYEVLRVPVYENWIIKKTMGLELYKKARRLINEVKSSPAGEIEVSPADKSAMDFYKELQAEFKDIYFEEYETKAIVLPLAKIIQKRGTIPPEIALILAVLRVEGRRVMQFRNL